MNSAPYSILFGDSRPPGVDETPEPDYFTDLHLDHVFAAIAGQADPFRLTSLYRYAVSDPAVLQLRQDVFDDVATATVHTALDDFSEAIAVVHTSLRGSESAYAHNQKTRMHLNGAVQYCAAVRDFGVALGAAGIQSQGLRTIATEFRTLARTPDFQALEAQATDILDQLDSLRFEVYLEGAHVTVGPEGDEGDYSTHLVGLFSRFRQSQKPLVPDAELERRYRLRQVSGDSVRDRIVSLVAELHPEPFRQLDDFYIRHQKFTAPVVSLFYREIQFYLRYADLTQRLGAANLPMVRPTLDQGAGLEVDGLYDIALAMQKDPHLVPNDVDLRGSERRVVVTGPNQGGKTTLSRAIGQIHHLAVLGCPIPGTRARLAPSDRIYTHFERAELGHNTGKLEDDLLRIQSVLAHATSASVVILNEIFASTTTSDAVQLATIVLDRIAKAGSFCVCVTFLDEIAHLPQAVSLVAQVHPQDPTQRTFKVVRAPANGRAYAAALADKHHLTYSDIKGRMS